MRLLLLSALAAATAVCGCAVLDHADPPVCDGAARRTANPHGSVLTSAPTPPPSTPPASASASALTSTSTSEPTAARGGCA